MVDEGLPLSRRPQIEPEKAPGSTSTWSGRLLQALHTGKHRTRAVLGGGGELGAAEISHHQRVAGEHEPRLVGAGAIAYQQANVLGRMAGSMQDRRGDIPQRQHFAVMHRMEWEGDVGSRRENVSGAAGLCQPASRRRMIGVNVRVDDEPDAHAGFLRRAQIDLDVADGVDHCPGGLAAAAEQIGDADRSGVQELAQDHRLALQPCPNGQFTLFYRIVE